MIITREIPDKYGPWLKCLTKHGTADNLNNIVTKTPVLNDHNKQYADSIMNVFTAANIKLLEEKMEEPAMCKAVNELFADDIRKLEAIVADKDSQLADKDS